MKKIHWIGFGLGFSLLALGLIVALSAGKKAIAANTGTATLSTNVQQYLALTVSSGGTVSFGSLTPGTPIADPAGGTVVSVTTNAGNGYTVGLSDGSDTNSAMLHTDTTTYIADYAGTLTTPTSWTGTGAGITLFAADTGKEAKWGTGTTYNDANNKYAGVPSAATTGHTVTGFHASADTSSWGFKVDVPNSQKTGSYSGNVTFTATAVLT
jgi:hypothetical protein